MSNPTRQRIIKVKVYGDSEEAVLEVLDAIRNLYAPNVTQSDLKLSEPHGVHGFLTVYLVGKSARARGFTLPVTLTSEVEEG